MKKLDGESRHPHEVMATCREVHVFGTVQCDFFEAEKFGNQAEKQPGRTVSNWQQVMQKKR